MNNNHEQVCLRCGITRDDHRYVSCVSFKPKPTPDPTHETFKIDNPHLYKADPKVEQVAKRPERLICYCDNEYYDTDATDAILDLLTMERDMELAKNKTLKGLCEKRFHDYRVDIESIDKELISTRASWQKQIERTNEAQDVNSELEKELRVTRRALVMACDQGGLISINATLMNGYLEAARKEQNGE
jgi:hypothetical protein